MGIRWIFVMAALLLNAMEIFSLVRCYSKVIPDIPVEMDSVVIETSIYLIYGKMVSSEFAVSQNDINVCIFATDSAVASGYSKEIRRFSAGSQDVGTYRIITISKYIRSRRQPVDTIIEATDTAFFKVFPDSLTPPRISNYKTYDYYAFVGETTPKRSYYYWNGDTLSIGMAFFDPATNRRFVPRVGLRSDTIILDLIDTSYNVVPAFNGYITVTSLSPLQSGTYTTRLRTESWGAYVKTSDTNFYTLTTNVETKGIGLGFKKSGQPEFILCPQDTLYMEFVIASPFLNTINILGFQPNPYFKTTGTGRIFIHNIFHNDTLMENWESFNRNDWHTVTMQQNDSINFDTMSNTTNGDHWIRMTYSNDDGNPVKGYVYKSLTPVWISSDENPSVSIIGAVKEPDSVIAGTLRERKLVKHGSYGLKVVHTRSNILFILEPSFPANQKETVLLTITDVQGKIVRTLGTTGFSCGRGRIVFIWDRRGSRGNPVPRGIYIVRLNTDRSVSNRITIMW
ncbi:MAG: hypothetical protein JXA71_16265 [Chitinispirillaceae bacterium]|nr:hypothetical protein [Chitinispirillaceae bacterium]